MNKKKNNGGLKESNQTKFPQKTADYSYMQLQLFFSLNFGNLKKGLSRAKASFLTPEQKNKRHVRMLC